MCRIRVLTIILLALVFAGTASAYTVNPGLSRASGGVEVRCYTQADMDATSIPGASGFFTGDTTQAFVALSPAVCQRIKSRKADIFVVAAWQTLAHETTHWLCWLNPTICDTLNENLVDCIGHDRREGIMRSAGLPKKYLRNLIAIGRKLGAAPLYCNGLARPHFDT